MCLITINLPHDLPENIHVHKDKIIAILKSMNFYDIHIVKSSKIGVLLEAKIHEVSIILKHYPNLHSITREYLRAIFISEFSEYHTIYPNELSFVGYKLELCEIIKTLAEEAYKIKETLDKRVIPD